MTDPATLGPIWASLPVPALIVDAEGRIDEVNPAAEAFLNLSARQLRGQPARRMILTDTPLEQGFERIRSGQSALFINDVELTAGMRTHLQCAIQMGPLNECPGAILMTISPRELADRMRGSDPKSAAKSAIGMAEMLAHEIKNPLAGISGAAQLLSMNLSPEDQELTDLIVEETRRIVKLLEQVEQFGNTRAPERIGLNIHDVLDRASRSARVGFGSHMRIIEDYDPSLPHAWADPDQLQQVFLNLLKNASEAAGPDGGTIRIRSFYEHGLRLRREDGTGGALPLNVEIIDDGPGIPPSVGNDAFEPFVSGRPNGTGLGLALVSKIITDHDGWIAVDSVPGRTVFRISLPMVPKERKV